MIQTSYEYEGLIEKFLNREIEPMSFLRAYMDNLKAEWNDLDEETYKILIFLFYELNDHTSDPILLAEKSDMFINEDRLRQSAAETLEKLRGLG